VSTPQSTAMVYNQNKPHARTSYGIEGHRDEESTQ